MLTDLSLVYLHAHHLHYLFVTFPTDMSSSLLFGYPQLAVIPNAGILGLTAYCFSTVAPLWAFAYLGPLIRRVCPDGFTLSEYIRRRFGWPVGVLSAVIFVGFMFCFMLVELNTYGSAVQTLGGVNPTVAALIVALSTPIYTAYGGFKASLWTDNVNAVIIMLFIVIASIAVGVKLDISHERVESSGLLKPQRLGGELWYILTAAIVFSQMFNQGFWQRAFASKDNKTLYLIEAHPDADHHRDIRAYDLAEDGSLSNERILINFYPGRSGDGMCIDAEGNLYVAAGLHATRETSETLDTRPGIHVISPAGELVAYRETPVDTITNCTFGDDDLRTLYVTCGKYLVSMRTQIPGKTR